MFCVGWKGFLVGWKPLFEAKKKVCVFNSIPTTYYENYASEIAKQGNTGKGILFQNGTKNEITWSKDNRLSRTIFKDANGKEVNFIPGNVWVEILPLNTDVSYENSN